MQLRLAATFLLFVSTKIKKELAMKKYFHALIFIFVSAFLFSSCRGYNAIMRDHLGDIENYTEYACTFIDENGSLFVVSLTNEPKDNMIYNNSFHEEYQKNVSFLTIIETNITILSESGFFDEIKSGDNIFVKASPFIYMDTNFFFIIGVRSENKVYLNEEIGLKNMIEMMNDNKSLL